MNYGLAVLAIGVTLAISILLTWSSISINLSILVAVAIIIPTWYGGKGPGLFVVATFQVVALSRLPTLDGSLAAYFFSQASALSVFVVLVLLVAWRRTAEKNLKDLNATLEKRVADRTAQLVAANKELEAFSYSVSHDLRAPLRHLNGFSLALLEDYNDKLDQTGRGYLKQVREASVEMGGLIDDVLKLARLSRIEMSSETVDMSALAVEIMDEERRRDPSRSVAVDIQPNLLVQGDTGLVSIMLTNLLCNSWKFTSKAKEAKISFGSEMIDGEMAYFIRDNGSGFDMEYADKLFGVFQRLHTSVEFEGTGIGLATVHRIVTRHGGRVWAEGAVDKGATFYFTLPHDTKR